MPTLIDQLKTKNDVSKVYSWGGYVDDTQERLALERVAAWRDVQSKRLFTS